MTSGGLAVTASARFFLAEVPGRQQLSGVTYTPAANFTGDIRIPFYAYDYTDKLLATGTVTVTVTAPAAFTDVSSGAWYYRYVSSLAGAGILGGYGDGTFRPENRLTCGEALKLIMMAAGYADLSIPGGGAAWAAGFLARAQVDGLVDGSVDLSAAITREVFVTIAAKALGLGPAANTPFRDTDSGYAAALYNTFVDGERIISGDGNGLFRPQDSIRRSEVCKIICLMRGYQA